MWYTSRFYPYTRRLMRGYFIGRSRNYMDAKPWQKLRQYYDRPPRYMR